LSVAFCTTESFLFGARMGAVVFGTVEYWMDWDYSVNLAVIVGNQLYTMQRKYRFVFADGDSAV